MTKTDTAFQTSRLGTFNIDEDDAVRVTDPAYGRSDTFSAVILNCAVGPWNAYVKRTVTEDGLSRIAELSCIEAKTASCLQVIEWSKLGVIGVDSCQAGILIDSKVPACESDAYAQFYELMCTSTLSESMAAVLTYGAISSSGEGDGFYSVETAKSMSRVVGVRIIFIEE